MTDISWLVNWISLNPAYAAFIIIVETAAVIGFIIYAIGKSDEELKVEK